MGSVHEVVVDEWLGPDCCGRRASGRAIKHLVSFIEQ